MTEIKSFDETESIDATLIFMRKNINNNKEDFLFLLRGSSLLILFIIQSLTILNAEEE